MKEKNIFFEKILDSVSNWHFHCNKSACARKSRFHDNEIFIKPCFFNFFRVFKFREAFKINFRFFFACVAQIYIIFSVFFKIHLLTYRTINNFYHFLMVLQDIDNFYHFWWYFRTSTISTIFWWYQFHFWNFWWNWRSCIYFENAPKRENANSFARDFLKNVLFHGRVAGENEYLFWRPSPKIFAPWCLIFGAKLSYLARKRWALSCFISKMRL